MPKNNPNPNESSNAKNETRTESENLNIEADAIKEQERIDKIIIHSLISLLMKVGFKFIFIIRKFKLLIYFN